MSARRIALAFWAGIVVLMLAEPGHALDNGQYGDVSPAVRAWFKSVKSKYGIPCCDMADGHPTDAEIRGEDYWVPIHGSWVKVPKEAVVDNAGNPFGQAVVWYSDYSGTIFIRCFVPGGGV